MIFQGYTADLRVMQNERFEIQADFDWLWREITAPEWAQACWNYGPTKMCNLVGPVVVLFDSGYFRHVRGMSDIVAVADPTWWSLAQNPLVQLEDNGQDIFMPPEMWFDIRFLRALSPRLEGAIPDESVGPVVGSMNWQYTLRRRQEFDRAALDNGKLSSDYVQAIACEVRGCRFVYELEPGGLEGCHHKARWSD